MSRVNRLLTHSCGSRMVLMERAYVARRFGCPRGVVFQFFCRPCRKLSRRRVRGILTPRAIGRGESLPTEGG